MVARTCRTGWVKMPPLIWVADKNQSALAGKQAWHQIGIAPAILQDQCQMSHNGFQLLKSGARFVSLGTVVSQKTPAFRS